MMNANDLETHLLQQIPMAKAMSVRVLKADQEIELACNLAPNQNHLGTAFGGSIGALLILAAYCRAFQLLDERAHILIKSNSTQFLLPVEEDLRATAEEPTPEVAEKFLRIYEKKGIARIILRSEMRLKNGLVACTMQGEFIAKDHVI